MLPAGPCFNRRHLLFLPSAGGWSLRSGCLLMWFLVRALFQLSQRHTWQRERACLGVSWMIIHPARPGSCNLHLTLSTSLVITMGVGTYYKLGANLPVQSTAWQSAFSLVRYTFAIDTQMSQEAKMLGHCWSATDITGYLRSTWSASLISLKLEVWAHIRSLL